MASYVGARRPFWRELALTHARTQTEIGSKSAALV